MASDGLIFKWMGQVHPRFQTPLYGTIFAGILTGKKKLNVFRHDHFKILFKKLIFFTILFLCF